MAAHELILGGARSGKSRLAEARAAAWLAAPGAALAAALARHGTAERLLRVSNEIGLGVMPMGRETRNFVDALGWLHQAVAAASARVTWVVAGCEMILKGAAR